MAYVAHTWVDVSDPESPPPGAPELNAATLNEIEAGIVEAVNKRVAVVAVYDEDDAVTVEGQMTLYLVVDKENRTFYPILEDGQTQNATQSPSQQAASMASDQVAGMIADAVIQSVTDKLQERSQS